MKKLSLLLCLLLLALPCAAFAAGDAASSICINASVIAPHTSAVTAPFSGTLLPFTLRAGDRIASGESLFELDTLKVYAPQTGRLAAVFAAAGDDASAVLSHYGALALIEPEHPLFVAASTASAYDDEETRYLHAGETLYLKCGSEKGTGRVLSVQDGGYTVEILSGNFDLNDTVRCYRESGHDSDSCTGSGKVRRFTDAAVAGSGRILRAHRQPGDYVRAGDLLFELIDPASTPDTDTCLISSPADGAVCALYTASGAQVYKGQLLCEITDLARLELSCEVDEIYLSRMRLGDVIAFELDAFPGEQLQGTVTEIRPLGEKRQNASYFDVRVSLPERQGVLPGMNGTVYLAK